MNRPDHTSASLMQKASAQFEKRMETALGPADYKQVAAFRTWLAKHPKRAAILAYLTYK